MEGGIREAENPLCSISAGAADPLHQHIAEAPFPSLAGLTDAEALIWCFSGGRDHCCCLGREGGRRQDHSATKKHGRSVKIKAKPG